MLVAIFVFLFSLPDLLVMSVSSSTAQGSVSQGTRTIYNFFCLHFIPNGGSSNYYYFNYTSYSFLISGFLPSFLISSFFSCLPMVFHLISHSASTGGPFFIQQFLWFVAMLSLVSCILSPFQLLFYLFSLSLFLSIVQ